MASTAEKRPNSAGSNTLLQTLMASNAPIAAAIWPIATHDASFRCGVQDLFAKFKEPASVVERWNAIWRDVLMQLPTIVYIGKFNQAHLGEHRKQSRDREHSVGIKANALAADRRGKKEATAWRDHALQLIGSTAGARGVERIAVTSETDVLDDVQARHARQRCIRKR